MTAYAMNVWVDGGPPALSAANLNKLEKQVFALTDGGFYLDSPAYSGTDDQRLTAAIADQQGTGGTTNYPPIILPSRPLTFNTPRTMYSGLKVVGSHKSGQKNAEISGGNFVGAEITLGSGITNGTNSWWNGNGGSIYDVYMADFAVQGNQGSPGSHQFMDVPSGTLYACHFDSLSFNFMLGVFGKHDRKCLMTQVALTGSWTMNNCWNCAMNVGGSDCIFFMNSFNNVGVSVSPVQYANDIVHYYFRFDSLEVNMGKAYLSSMNGFRGMLVSGSGGGVELHGGVFEGYKPTRISGLNSGPAPGTVIKQTGSSLTMFGTKVGQFMDNPDATENGGVDISGGECSMFGVEFYGTNIMTENSINHTGGRLSVYGTTRRQNEGHTGRPRLRSTAPIASQSNLDATYTLAHDHSMRLV